MELVEQLQKLIPWAAGLPLVPKMLVSLVIASVAALLLAVIWTTPSQEEVKSLEVVKTIVKDCYRRAVFTRTHAQMSHEAMFSSIAECRGRVQKLAPEVNSPELSQMTADLISALEGIERQNNNQQLDFKKIDFYKLEALRRLTSLAGVVQVGYTIPTNLTEDVFFSKEEADMPPIPKLPISQ